MRFKDYLLKEEFDEQCRLFELCDSIDPDWMLDESVWDMAKGAWNTGVGAAKSVAGALTMGDEALARSMGQGTKGRFKRGWEGFKGGLKQTFVGAPKQPQQQPQSKQTYKDKDGNTVIKYKDGSEEKFSPEEMEDWKAARRPLVNQPQQAPQQNQQQAPQAQSENPRWSELVAQYRASKTRDEKNNIQAIMARSYPRQYKAAKDRADEMKARSRQPKMQTA